MRASDPEKSPGQRQELALVTAKGGADVGATSAFVLPMVGTMTIITSFLSHYVVKFGMKNG